jgi:ACS family allantoate permease-like MFS transporter
MVSGEKLRRRTLTCAAPHIISMTGAILVWKLPNSAKKARLAGFYLTLVFNISMVACMSLISSNVVGRTKKTVSAAAFFIFTCVGNLIGPQTFRKKHAPRYEPALITIVICNILAMCAMLLLFMYYRRENRRRDDLAKQNAAATTELSHLAEHETGEADLTDRENLHFRYVL